MYAFANPADLNRHNRRY